MNVNIALLAGDGIGPEIIAQAVKALDRVARKYAHNFTYREALVGACAIDATGDPYPEETHKICREADAVLFGAIGDPKYDNDPKAPVRPEQGLLRMRKSLGLFANLRPIALFDTLADRSPLKAEVVRGTDFVCVRELTGGIYFGRPQGRDEGGDRWACFRRPAWGPKSRFSSRSTAPIRRPQAKTSPTRWLRSSRPPCCSNIWG